MTSHKCKQSVVCNYCGALAKRFHTLCKECGHTLDGWVDKTKYQKLVGGNGFMARNFGPGNPHDPQYNGFYE
jgi:ribosomal protein L32